MSTEPRILTSYEWPPAPGGGYWIAWDDVAGTDTSPVGVGQPEQEAIDDLLAQMDDAHG